MITTERVAAVSLAQVKAAQDAVERIEAAYSADREAKAAAITALNTCAVMIGLMVGEADMANMEDGE